MIWNPPYPPSPLKTLARIGTILAVGGGAYLWKKYQQNKGRNIMQNASSSQVYEEPYPFGKMETAQGKIALKSVVLNGTIEGLLFSSSIIQEYKNEETEALEVIYTFPLGYNTALLGLSATIGDRELNRKIILIISDGVPDNIDETKNAIAAHRSHGHEVYGVGIENRALEQLLDGKYARTIYDLNELAPAMFNMLRATLLKGQGGGNENAA